MITTVREFISSVKMMRTAQKLYEKTPSQRLKKKTDELEKDLAALFPASVELCLLCEPLFPVDRAVFAILS